MSLTSLILKFAAPLPKPESFDRFLFIGPHPDDIEIGAGATAAKLAAAGKTVCFLICTDGRYGTENLDEGLSPEALAAKRREEALASAARLGVSDVRFLDLSDGSFYTDDELLSGIAAVMTDFQPQILFAPDPSPTNELHPDHLRVGRAAGTAALFSYNEVILARLGAKPAPVKAIAFYMTAKPTAYVRTAGFLDAQLAALACHRSQFPEGSAAYKDICTYLRLRAVNFGLRRFAKSAEGFRVLGSTHMHCLSEFGK